MKHKTEIFGAIIGAALGPAWPVLIPLFYIIYLFKEGDWGFAFFLLLSIIGIFILIVYNAIEEQESMFEELNTNITGIRRPPVKGYYPQYTVPFIHFTPEEEGEAKVELPLGASLERCKMFLAPETIDTREFVFGDQEQIGLCNQFQLPIDGKFSMQIGDNNLLNGIFYHLFLYHNLDRLGEIRVALQDAKNVMQNFADGQPTEERKDGKTTYTWTGNATASDGYPVFMYINISMDVDLETEYTTLRLYISSDYDRLNSEWVKNWH